MFPFVVALRCGSQASAKKETWGESQLSKAERLIVSESSESGHSSLEWATWNLIYITCFLLTNFFLSVTPGVEDFFLLECPALGDVAPVPGALLHSPRAAETSWSLLRRASHSLAALRCPVSKRIYLAATRVAVLHAMKHWRPRWESQPFFF